MKNQKTKYVILGLLTIEPMSGYEMKKIIETGIRHFWAESNGQIYPALRQLVKENLVVLEGKLQNGKKISHIYSITEQGLAELENWLQATTDGKRIHRDEELLKLFFGSNLPPSVLAGLLKKRQRKVEETLVHYRSVQKELKDHADSPHHLYWSLCLRNGILSAEAELQWCQESIQILERGQDCF
jgi:PadR family transcriptional regulator, regulatory protein AphA